MRLYKSCLLPATCTIILAVTTYATTTQATRQAEVKLQQVAAASPSRSLKYGDKTTKKIPNQEVNFLPTSSTVEKFKNNLPAAEKENFSRNRSRLRAEQRKQQDQSAAHMQISRRLDIVTEQNQLHEVPIALKNSALRNLKITTTVGQQRTSSVTSRSRNTNSAKQIQQQQQPTQYYNLNIESEKDIGNAKDINVAKTSHKTRQRSSTTITTTKSTTNANQIPLSSHHSNVRTHRLTANNATIVGYYHNNQRNKNNNKNNNNFNSTNSQPLLTSSNAVATNIGIQTKDESSSNARKQTGNVSSNQSVSSNNTNNFRSRGRKFSSNASTITIISSTSTSTTTTTTTPRIPTFQFPSTFNIFTPEFWQFLGPASSPVSRLQQTTPATTTTRKPPKKYKPPAQLSTKEEKLSLVKLKPTQPSRTTTKLPQFVATNNSIPRKDEGPFRIALPTFNILSSKRETNDEGEKGKRNVDKETIYLRERFDCPRESEVRFQLFPKICKIDEDCKQWNREELCCEIFGAKSCVSGIPKPLEETSHAPILGVIPRKCPSRPLAELWWEVKECETDMDCWPRVCCPDGRRRYCRTSQPELNTVPVPVQRSFNYLAEYLECTPPPPAIFDLHPKPCTSTLDCFPNVCCQEAGLRHCRPPKKSVLTMLANVFNVDFVKRLTQNIVIK